MPRSRVFIDGEREGEGEGEVAEQSDGPLSVQEAGRRTQLLVAEMYALAQTLSAAHGTLVAKAERARGCIANVIATKAAVAAAAAGRGFAAVR